MAAPAVALAGGYAAYHSQPQPQLNPVASTVAGYHAHTLTGSIIADGSGQPMTTQPPSSGKSGQNNKSSTSTSTSTSRNTTQTARPRPSVRVRPAHRSSTPAKVPAPTVLPSAPVHHQPSPPPARHRRRPAPTPSKSPSGGGSGSLKSAVQKDIANGNYELAVAQYLVENGYSKAAAAGVVGCVDGESGGNPESVGSGGGGLIGWTPISSAAPNANIITGNPAQDMMTQLADILYYNSNEIGQSLVNQLNSQTNPVAAADFFSQNFEKPAVVYSDVRPAVAQQIFSELGG